MDLLICHSCGTVLRGKMKNCTGCSLALSESAPTPLPTLSRSSDALAVMVRPDPIVLERLLVRHQSQVWLRDSKRANGSGGSLEESNGNGNPGNGVSTGGAQPEGGVLNNGSNGSGNGNGGSGNGSVANSGADVAVGHNGNGASGNGAGTSSNGNDTYAGSGNGSAQGAGGANAPNSGVPGGIGQSNGGFDTAPGGTGQSNQAASGSYPASAQTPSNQTASGSQNFAPGQSQGAGAPVATGQPDAAYNPNHSSGQQSNQNQAASGQYNSYAPDSSSSVSVTPGANAPSANSGGANWAPENNTVPQGAPGQGEYFAGAETAPPVVAAQQNSHHVTSAQAAGAAPGGGVDFFDTPVARQMTQAAGAVDPSQSGQYAPSSQGGAPPVPMMTAAAYVHHESVPPPMMTDATAPPVALAPALIEANAAAETVQMKKVPSIKPSDLDFFAATSAYPTEAANRASSSQHHSSANERSAESTSSREAPSLDEVFPFEDEVATARSSSSARAKKARDDDDDDDDDDYRSKNEPKKIAKKSAAPSKLSNSKTRGRQVEDDDDDDHDDDEIETSRSRSGKKQDKAAPKNRTRGDDDDDDDDDDDEISPPARRSFSGNAPTFKGRPPAKKDVRKPSPSERIANRGKQSIKVRERNNNDGGDDSGNFLTQEVNVLGLSMKRQTQLAVAVVGLVVFGLAFQLVGTAMSGLFSGQGMQQMMPQSQSQDPLLLGGDWKLTYQDGAHSRSTKLRMQYTNDQVMGDGVDGEGQNAMPYLFNGTIQRPDGISFTKRYSQSPDDATQRKPIEYFGKLDLGEGRPKAHGIWRTEIVTGKFIHARVVKLQGAWDAELVKAHTYIFNSAVGTGPSTIQTGGTGSTATSKEQASMMFVKGLMIFLGIAIFLVWLVWNMFGTNGIMSVRGKQQYIPSQYKGDHRKIMKQLGKAVVAGSMPLGTRLEWKPYFPWEKKELALPPEIRNKDPHMLVLGAGDKGKTRFIASLVAHDIESNDRAVVVIDSDGNLVDMLTRWMSNHPKGKQFSKRVIVLDPTSKKGSLAYNPLEMPDDGDLQSAASSLVYGFKAIYTEPPGSQSQWNAQTANILRNSALLLMANGKTLTDLPTLLQDNDFRDILLENVEKKKRDKVEYGTLLDTWGQYKKLARTDQWITWTEPILNRVGPMLSDPRIRPILTKPASDIRMSQVIKQKQILLVKIAKGQLDENANLLGSLIVTGLKQAAMSLNSDSEEKPSALYLDEFDDFIEKETLEAITTETDRFQIGFVGSIKTLQHLPEDFRNQLIISVGTIACFALSKKDGDLLGPQMFRVDGRKIKHQTMSNFFNPVNSSPQFELISDEEKLNIDRVVGQDARNFYCYRVGSQAGVFHMKSHDFNDIDDKDVNWKLIDRMHSNGTKPTDKES